MKPQGVTFIYKEIFMKGLTKMDATISTVIIIIAALSTAGVVNTIGFSTSVQACTDGSGLKPNTKLVTRTI
jgi:hypothetical protein